MIPYINKFSKELFESAKKTLQNDLYDNQKVEFEKEEVLSNPEIATIRDMKVL